MKMQTKLSIMLASIALLVVSAASLVSAKGWVQVGGNWYYQNADGDYVTETVQSSGTSKFYLGEDGAMVTDYFLESYGNGDNTYYFGSNGAMVTNTWVAIDPSVVSDQGDYVPDAYWYYFQGTGKAVKASGDSQIKKTTIDGKKYAFNTAGQMLTGWILNDGNVVNADEEDYPYANAIYYAGGDNDGVLHSGWLTYYDSGEEFAAERDFMYFYFNPTNNKKIGFETDVTHISSSANGNINYVTKKINGRTYAFQVNTGVMLIEWEGYYPATTGVLPATNSNPWYFSAQDDGHRAQKGWVLTVPAYDIDRDDYMDDEEDWFYFNNNGDMVFNQIKKINGKYYAFNKKGEMKKGLIVFRNGEFVTGFNMDNTQGGELSKAGIYRDSDNRPKHVTKGDFNSIFEDGSGSLHYFGDDGARRTGSNNIEFADDEYTFGSNNSGAFEGTKSKKYYSLGIQLKASPDIRYGLIVASESYARTGVTYANRANGGPAEGFYVLNTSGAKVRGANTAKKDADGNFWLIDKETDKLVGVYTVQVRYGKVGEDLVFQFKGDVAYNDGASRKTVNNTWIPYYYKDNNGNNEVVPQDSTNRAASSRNYGMNGDYKVDLSKSMDYALNFYWSNLAQRYDQSSAMPTA